MIEVIYLTIEAMGFVVIGYLYVVNLVVMFVFVYW